MEDMEICSLIFMWHLTLNFLVMGARYFSTESSILASGTWS